MKYNYQPAVIAGLNDAAISIVRSLGSKGIRIIGLYDQNVRTYYIKSKYIYKRYFSPLNNYALIENLIGIARDLKEKAVLFCTSDSSVLTVSMHEKRLRPYYEFVLPPFDITSRQISKKGFYEFAVENSFAVPKTVFVKGINEIRKNNITFPCIIKPEFRDTFWSEKVSEKVLLATSKEHLLEIIEKYRLQNASLVLQEWINGEDTEIYFCLAYINRKKKAMALCTGRKLRQHPHLTGSTSIAETIIHQKLTSETLRFLEAAGCIGFCSVEFKYSQNDGKFYITEPTVGRPDTQEGICLGAGLDIPFIAYLDAIGEDVTPLTDYQEGIKWINEPLEFYSLRNNLTNGLSFKKVFYPYKGKRSYALWDKRDPMPAIYFYKDLLKKGIKKIMKVA